MLDEIYKATYIVSTGQKYLKENKDQFKKFSGRKVKDIEAKKTENGTSNIDGEAFNKQRENTKKESRGFTDSNWFKLLKSLLIIAILLKVLTYFISETGKLVKAAKSVEAAILAGNSTVTAPI